MGESLGKDLHAVDVNGVLLAVQPEDYMPVRLQVFPEAVTLFGNPVQGNADCQEDKGVIHSCQLHFFGDSRKGEDVVILIFILILDEGLVLFADDIVLPAIEDHVSLEIGILVIDGDACFEAGVRRLDVAIPLINTDDHVVGLQFTRISNHNLPSFHSFADLPHRQCGFAFIRHCTGRE